MVAKGEMNTEEARRFVEDMMKQAKQPPKPSETPEKSSASEPRRIEILEEDEAGTAKDSPKSADSSADNVDHLREQVLQLQRELQDLQKDK